MFTTSYDHEKSESGGKSKIHKNNGRNPGVFLPPLFLPPLSDFLRYEYRMATKITPRKMAAKISPYQR